MPETELSHKKLKQIYEEKGKSDNVKYFRIAGVKHTIYSKDLAVKIKVWIENIMIKRLK